MIERQPPLNVSVLCEGIDGRVWPVMTQQRRHLTLQTSSQSGGMKAHGVPVCSDAVLSVNIPAASDPELRET